MGLMYASIFSLSLSIDTNCQLPIPIPSGLSIIYLLLENSISILAFVEYSSKLILEIYLVLHLFY